MATRAKYTRVRAPEEDKEEKPDTDIIMRFSPTYGITIQLIYRQVYHQGSHSLLR